MSDATQFIQQTLPELFRRGLALLDSRGEAGDTASAAFAEDVRAASGASLVHIEGTGSYYVSVDSGEMKVTQEPLPDVPVRMAVAGSVEGLELFLRESGDEAVADDRTALGVARMASKRAEDLVAGQRIAMHVVIEDVPELGELTLRVGVGMDEPPAEPDFTATVSYDALEEMREKGQNAQQAFMAGKIRLAGNYAPALSLAMQLAQPAR
ncbi:MAG: SCP2 sterol-binding domain-containing protein [Deltaproteobacteria bacterium]|nr:SCP2 sterol-binding domain-containing protein [Deltaproteobacteria bacterium]